MICIGGSWHGRNVVAMDGFNNSQYLPKLKPVTSAQNEAMGEFIDLELYHKICYGLKSGRVAHFLGCQEIPGEELKRLCDEYFKNN